MNKKIVKLQWGNSVNWSAGNASYNPQAAFGATNFKSNPLLFNLSNGFTLGSTLGVPNVSNFGKYIMNNPKVAGNSTSPSMGQQALSGAVSQIGGALANNIGNTLFDLDTHFGSIMGGLFSSASSSALGNLSSNILNGNALTQGMGKDMLGSVGSTAAGIAANYAGRGITKAMGNSNLGKFTGAAAANVGGTLGGAAISRALGTASGGVNPLALGMTAVGAGLGAMNGPSKEYGGKYGDITKTMDTIYDLASVGVNLLPGGLFISAAMVLNKGLSNTFGSTSGMTKQDAILGSAFMPAPVKWANVLGGKTTSTFNKQSWQNSEKTSNFMQNAFGDLLDRFDKARTEAGKTYGTFSRRAYKRALANINFANQAWDKVLSMADLNIYQNIRAQDMASINNQKYMQDIQGGFSPLARGKQGMKILSNRINHNTGMRLLSGAALIDNKQMILSALTGIKVQKLQLTEQVAKSDNTRVLKPVVMGPIKRKLKPGQLLFNNHGKLVVVEPKRTYIQQDNRDSKIREESHRRSVLVREQELMRKAEKQTALVAGAILDRTIPSYWIQKATGQDLGTAGRLVTDLAAPLVLGKGVSLLGKTKKLINVPQKRSTLKGFNFNDLPQEKYVYNNKTGDFDVIAPKKEWIRRGEELTKEYFGEHLYDLLISRGSSPKDAAMVASTRYYGTINAKPGVLRNLGKNTYGESLLLNEKTIQPVYNFRKHVPASLNDANTTLETVFHELGGHGSSFNILYGLPLKINEVDFIRLMKILDHNEKLRPKLKPFYLAVKDGDFKLAETLAPKDGTLKGINGEIDYKKLQDFIKYMEKNLEYTARAIATNMGEHYGLRKDGWNIKLLRLFFTDESVDNLLKNVWNYGVPVTVGGSTAATLYNNK